VISGIAVVVIAFALAMAGSRERAGDELSPREAGGAGERAPRTSPPTESAPDVTAETGTAADDRRPAPGPLPDTDDPDVYAQAVTEALHSVDHASERGEDYESLFASALWDEIVPDAREAILASIYSRIPDDRLWQQMSQVSQRATFTVDEVWEPRVGLQGRDEQWWPPGVVLRTVTGTQTETWQPPDAAAQSSSRPVALTVVVACPPAASPCRLVGIQPSVEA
jgi:hypothetical protein